MKKPFRTLAACSLGIAALACASPALAQSYWRVDAGLSKSRKADFKEGGTTLACGNAACTEGAVFDDLKSSPLFDFGWGYRFGRYFHSDITFAFRNAYHLDTGDKSGETLKAEIQSKAVMLNLYLDFPTSSGANPYVGIGIGASQNKVSDINGRNFRGIPDTAFSVPGGKKTGAAGAFMVGVSMPTSGGGAVEFGFRVVSLGKLQTEAGDLTVTSAGLTATTPFNGMTGRLRATEWTIGLRF